MVFVAYGPPQRPVFGPGSVVRLRCWSVRCLEVSVVFLARKGGLRGGTGFLAISSRVAGLPLLLFFFCFFCHFAILGSFILILIVLNIVFSFLLLFLAFLAFLSLALGEEIYRSLISPVLCL